MKFAGDAVQAVDVLEQAQARLGDSALELRDRLEVNLLGCAYSSVSARRMLADKDYRRGHLADAEADARAALNLASEVHGSQGFLSAALGTLIYASLDRGTADADGQPPVAYRPPMLSYSGWEPMTRTIS